MDIMDSLRLRSPAMALRYAGEADADDVARKHRRLGPVDRLFIPRGRPRGTGKHQRRSDWQSRGTSLVDATFAEDARGAGHERILSEESRRADWIPSGLVEAVVALRASVPELGDAEITWAPTSPGGFTLRIRCSAGPGPE
jgi:hypothetical protein